MRPSLIAPAQGVFVRIQDRSPTMIVWLVPSVMSLTPIDRLRMKRPLPPLGFLAMLTSRPKQRPGWAMPGMTG